MEFATSTAIRVSTQQPSTSDSPWERLYNHPDVVAARKDIANGWRKAHEAGFVHYLRGRPFGLYDDPSTIDDDALSWKSTNTALTVSPSIVALSYDSGIILWKCSGIVLKLSGFRKIVTCAYILGDRCWDESPETHFEVNVILPNGDKVQGVISHLDAHHNIAVVDAPELPATVTAALFDTNECKLGDAVTAVGRHESCGLLIFPGKINIRKDHLESDDLMSSSCSINERGIGGPLVNNTSGMVIGLNIFSKKCATPFIPSYILLTCVRHLLYSGFVTRPYLGVKIRSLNEAKISELELIYAKFRTTSGVLVTQVTKGSPADMVGICAGDVIISSLKTPISSPLKFAKVLFENVRPIGARTRRSTELMLVEVTIGNMDSGTIKSCTLCPERFSPPVIDRWPVLPNNVLQ